MKAKIILSALITLYGICGLIYSAVLLVKSQGHTGTTNIYIIYAIVNLLFFICGVAFLFRILSRSRPDDTDSELRYSYASFRHSVNNLP